MIPMAPIVQEPQSEVLNLGEGVGVHDVHLGLSPEGGQGQPILTGLGPLKSHNRLLIKQKLQTCEILTGCEQENRFNVTGAQGEILYWAKENSSCCDRFWCGNVRAFDMTITDQTTNEVMRLFRPLTCQGCCCSALYPHCTQVATSPSSSSITQALTVSVAGETVGTVRERAT